MFDTMYTVGDIVVAKGEVKSIVRSASLSNFNYGSDEYTYKVPKGFVLQRKLYEDNVGKEKKQYGTYVRLPPEPQFKILMRKTKLEPVKCLFLGWTRKHTGRIYAGGPEDQSYLEIDGTYKVAMVQPIQGNQYRIPFTAFEDQLTRYISWQGNT